MSRRSKGDMAAGVLVNARTILAVPEKVARVATARDRAGQWVDPRAPSAVAWCPYGALYIAVPHRTDEDYRRRNAARTFLDGVVARKYQQTTIGWWDRTPSTHTQLMEVFDEAIADARSDRKDAA